MIQIQIVIDMPEDIFNLAKKYDEDGCANWSEMLIANGTVLPKGHGRLIDADKILKDTEGMEDNLCDEKDKQSVRYLRIEMESAPTVIEADKESVTE